jgi:hypothetical protein
MYSRKALFVGKFVSLLLNQLGGYNIVHKNNNDEAV